MKAGFLKLCVFAILILAAMLFMGSYQASCGGAPKCDCGPDAICVQGQCVAHDCTEIGFSDQTYLYCQIGEKNWQEAQDYCGGRGANLVTISSKAENDFLKNFGMNCDCIWMGFTDKAQEGEWQWISGWPVRYLNWSGAEPNNYGGNENCGQIPMTQNPSYFWADVNCDSSCLCFMCESNVCVPDCDNKECGADGCFGSCGECELPEECDWFYQFCAVG